MITARPMGVFWNSADLQKLFFIYAINNILFIPFLHFEDLLTAGLKFKAVFLGNLVRVGLLTLFIGTSFFFRMDFNLVDLAIVQLLATVVAAVVLFPFVRDMVKYDRVMNRKLLADLFHFGKFTFGTNMSSMFIRSTDSWMIGRLMSTAAVAVYSPALKLANIFEVPTGAIANFIFPQIHSRMQEQGKDGVRHVYLKSVSLMLALILPMVLPLFVFSEFFIGVIFGNEYLEAADILKVTILYSLILPFNRQFGTVMDGLKKPRINFYLLVLTAVMNVLFNYLGLKYYGLIGSAYGTLLSYVILFTFNQIILFRTFNINPVSAIPAVFQWYRTAWNLLAHRLTGAWK
jgi:O-antigen/teichoic acid export membrane protein